MKAASRRGLITFAFVSEALQAHQDIFMGLMPLFRPIAEDLAGEVFDAAKLVQQLRDLYGLSMTTDVAEYFIPRLHQSGLLVGEDSTDTSEGGVRSSRAAYLWRVETGGSSDEGLTTEVGEQIEQVVAEFQTFVGQVQTLFTLNYSDDSLAEILFDWLVTSDQALGPAMAAMDGAEAAASDLSKTHYKEEEYLCARFVEHLKHEKPELFDALARIASAALVSEVVLDLKNPPGREIQAKDLVVYADGPLCMDWLGVSGAARKDNATYIFEKLLASGAKVRVFEHSLREIQDNLSAVLKKHPLERVGPTADAMRRGELAEPYAVAVRDDVESLLVERGVQLIREGTVSPVNEITYFDDDLCLAFSNTLHGWFNDLARERDVASIAHVMRKRGGKQHTDFFRVGHVMVSHNPVLARRAYKFCVDEGLMTPGQTAPCVHQRRVAALLWITVGPEERLQMSRRQLVANCDTALRIRPEVVDSMRSMLMQVKPEVRDQFDVLVSRPRGAQLAMDLTLSVSQVVNQENIEAAYEAIRESAAEKERIEFNSRLEGIEQQHSKAIERRDETIESLSSQLEQADDAREALARRDRETFESWVGRAKFWATVRLHAARVALSLLVLVAAVGGVLAPAGQPGTVGWVAAIVAAGLGLAPIWWPKWGWLGRIEARLREQHLARLASIGGRLDLLNIARINWTSGKVTWRESTEPPETLV